MSEAIAGVLLVVALIAAAAVALLLVRTLIRRGLVAPERELQLLFSAGIFAVMLFAVVEMTSLFRLLSTAGLTGGWVLAAFTVYLVRGKIAQGAAGNAETAERQPYSFAAIRWNTFSFEEKLLAFGTALIVTLLFLLAVLTPPTSWDSMTYHLPRVLNWIQNESVAPFVTSDTRQVESGPFPAYAVMQFFLATGNDRLVNLAQWIAMMLSLCAVSWLAGEIARWINHKAGTSRFAVRTARLWAVFFAATMPIGIVQAISTQTDYMVALWFVASCVFGWLLVREPRNVIYAAAFGAAIGLGVISKATMVVIASVFAAALFVWALLRSPNSRTRARIVMVTALAIAAIVTPHFSRNFRLFGSPVGSQYIHALMRNPVATPSAWWSNFTRNLSLHAASGIEPLTGAVNSALAAAHRWSGRDPNDRATTFHTSTFSYRTGYPISDNSAGNFWHGLLLLLGAALVLIRIPAGRKPLFLIGALSLASFTLLSGYLRWNEWNGRFHLGYFLLLAPVAAAAFASSRTGGKAIIGIVLAVVGLHATFYNKSRPVLGGSDFLFLEREQQYFIEVPYLYEPMLQAASDIVAARCDAVGLRIYKDFFDFLDEMEYPLWVMLAKRGFNGTIHNVAVTNETARLAQPIQLHALVSSARGPDEEVSASLRYKTTYPPLKVYWAESASRWAQLSQLAPDASQRPLATNDAVIDFTAANAVLLFRAPRQGIFRLEGGFADGQQLLSGATAVGIESYAGFAYTSRSATNLHLIELPLPQGQTAIHLRNELTPAQAPFFALAYWRWFPTDQSLPYIYVTRIFAPDPAPTNSMILEAGDERSVEIFSGAQGVVDVAFLSQAPAGELHLGGFEVQTNMMFQGGAATARIPIQRGTNQFNLVAGTNQPAVTLETIRLRFVDFIDEP